MFGLSPNIFGKLPEEPKRKKSDWLGDIADWGSEKVRDFGSWLTSSDDKNMKQAGATVAAHIGSEFVKGLAKGFQPMKAGGRVPPQSASFGNIGPKYNLMPVNDFPTTSFFDLRNDLPPGRMNYVVS